MAKGFGGRGRDRTGDPLLAKRQTEFAKSCRSRRNTLRNSKLSQNGAKPFSPFCSPSVRNLLRFAVTFTTFPLRREDVCHQTVWVVFGLTGPLCASAPSNFRFRRELSARGHRDWPVKPVTRGQSGERPLVGRETRHCLHSGVVHRHKYGVMSQAVLREKMALVSALQEASATRVRF
jgi:hypothetical protein